MRVSADRMILFITMISFGMDGCEKYSGRLQYHCCLRCIRHCRSGLASCFVVGGMCCIVDGGLYINVDREDVITWKTDVAAAE